VLCFFFEDALHNPKTRGNSVGFARTKLAILKGENWLEDSCNELIEKSNENKYFSKKSDVAYLISPNPTRQTFTIQTKGAFGEYS